jgi:hypothetical protein
VLERLTPLQVLHHLCDMVTLMFAAPAGVGEVSHVHAYHESGLFLRGVLGCPHVFPFCDEYREARVFRLACGEGVLISRAKLMPWHVF